jgi:ubiquinone/menaquinone biosynthesis C-methylase UbiE
MRDRKVLEIGFGPGYDALTFLENGADYQGIDITPENVERTRKHLAFYGYEPKVQQGDAENLPFADDTFDVAFSNGVLHHVPDMEKAFSEAFRVVRPGGKAIFILYIKNSLFYRVNLDIWQHRILGGWRKMSLEDRLRGIEANEAGERPLVRVYSQSEVASLMCRAGFMNPHSSIRKLVWEDLPYAPIIGRLNRYMPQSLLSWAGKRWGWYVITSAMKP